MKISKLLYVGFNKSLQHFFLYIYTTTLNLTMAKQSLPKIRKDNDFIVLPIFLDLNNIFLRQ